MRIAVIVALLSLFAGMAGATILSCPDFLGVYFDATNDMNNVTMATNTPTTMHFVITRAQNQIAGVEFGYRVVTPVGLESLFFRLSESYPTSALNLGDSSTPAAGDYIVGYAAPIPVTPGNDYTVVTWSVMILTPMTVDIFVGPSSVESIPDGLPAYEIGGTVLPLGVPNGPPAAGNPVARINGDGLILSCGDTPPPPPPVLDPIDLSVMIDVSAGSYTDNGNLASTDSLATVGYDSGVDIPQPGPAPSTYLTASFYHPEWPLGPRFQTDIRPSYRVSKEVKTWPFMVETDIDGTVNLDFTPSFTPDINVRFHLRDLQTGLVSDMLGVPRYSFENIGDNTYQFELIIENIRPMDLNPDHRNLPTDWVLVGLPVLPDNGHQSIGAAIMDAAPGAAFAYEYTGPNGYSLVQDNASWNQGTGLWFATDTAFDWSVPGTRDLDTTTIPINEGWNIVGSPMWFPATREGIIVQQNGVDYTWSEAATAGLVAAAVQGFDPASGAYVNSDTLQAWQGYWISALQPGLDLLFDWRVFDALAQPTKALAEQPPLDPNKYWQTTLTMTGPDKQQRSLILGVRPTATDGFDAQWDAPRPPASPRVGPRFGSQHPAWDLACGEFLSEDYLQPESPNMVWHTRITLPKPGSVKLDWTNLMWPEGMDLQLYLPAENRVAVMSMREQNEVTLELATTSLEVVVRTPDALSAVADVPGPTYKLGAYPNPFNPMTTITFELPAPGQAVVMIYSVRGELLAVLGDRSYPAGEQTVVWQGTDRQGRSLPSGSYFARLRVDGRDRGHVMKMSLIR